VRVEHHIEADSNLVVDTPAVASRQGGSDKQHKGCNLLASAYRVDTASASLVAPDTAMVLELLHKDWGQPQLELEMELQKFQQEQQDLEHQQQEEEVEKEDRSCE